MATTHKQRNSLFGRMLIGAENRPLQCCSTGSLVLHGDKSLALMGGTGNTTRTSLNTLLSVWLPRQCSLLGNSPILIFVRSKCMVSHGRRKGVLDSVLLFQFGGLEFRLGG